MKKERVPTYIKGFDGLVEGGFPKQALVLVSGGPGTGKSIFCMNTLYNNALKGKKCLYITIEQPGKAVTNQMQNFGWNHKKVKKNLEIEVLSVADPMLEITFWDKLKESKYDLVAVDSLAAITETIIPIDGNKMSVTEVQEKVLPTELTGEEVARIKINRIIDYLRDAKVTALLIGETIEGQGGYSRDKITEFLCDGIIDLDLASVGEEESRTLHVLKMRETKINAIPVSFTFSNKGFTVYSKK